MTNIIEILSFITNFIEGITSIVGAAAALAVVTPQVGIIGNAIHALACNFGLAENK